jgi:hypothetical protein
MDGERKSEWEREGERGANDGFVPRVELIEDQPLASRAEAYAQLHDELRAELEGGDVQRHG